MTKGPAESNQSDPQEGQPNGAAGIPIQARQIEGREWWLWGFAVAVTLVLTLGIVGLTLPSSLQRTDIAYWSDLREWVRGLAGLVLLFDIYTMYQHRQLQQVRRKLAERDQLFQLITENAADMIAVVDNDGHRLYNSPAYQKVLGYSSQELKTSSSLEQVHPDDRQRVLEAATKARLTGRGERLEYRIRHKDGSWRMLESTASAVRNANGETERLVIVNRDITERKRAEELLEHGAFHDGLTSLPNRALFLDRLRRACALFRRHSDYKFAVLFIDIDEFKIFNDSLGHARGDELLVNIAQRLKSSLREIDTVSRSGAEEKSEPSASADTLARLGGDEFTVLVEDIRHPSDAVRVAERIQERLAIPFVVGGQEVVITASIGIALNTAAGHEAEDMIRDTEIAMYRAKRMGKARCEVFDPAMYTSAVKRLRLETELRKALEMGEFRVYYQPIVSLGSGRITGFEALSRWQRAGNLVMPGEFIEVADQTGLILPMNRQLMHDACEQLRSWHSQFPSESPLLMSVNITAKQFAQPDLASQIGQILRESRIDPRCLQLEITETIAMGDAQRAASVLSELKALGVSLSVDDFGTGYSSLSRLQRFPVDTLKIDRSFIAEMHTNVEAREMVRIIIMLAHNLGLKVVAEGTETREQVDELRQLNCELAQGYFFAKPSDAQTAVELLTNGFRQAVTAE